MKIIFLFSALLTFNAFASECRVSYKGPKLAPGGRCLENIATAEECEKAAEQIFNGHANVTSFIFSKKQQAVVFKTWKSQYRKVTMTFQEGEDLVSKNFNRSFHTIVPEIVDQWSRSCDVKACFKNPDPGSCWDACQLDIEYQQGLNLRR